MRSRMVTKRPRVSNEPEPAQPLKKLKGQQGATRDLPIWLHHSAIKITIGVVLSLFLALWMIYSIVHALTPLVRPTSLYSLGRSMVGIARPVGLFVLLWVILLRLLRSDNRYRTDAARVAAKAGLQRLAFDAVPVNAYVVGNSETTYHVLITFDPSPDEAVFMSGLAAHLVDDGVLASIVGPEFYIADRRLLLAQSLTHGRTVYLADLMIAHSRHAGQIVITPFVACTAEVGGTGRIALRA